MTTTTTAGATIRQMFRSASDWTILHDWFLDEREDEKAVWLAETMELCSRGPVEFPVFSRGTWQFGSDDDNRLFHLVNQIGGEIADKRDWEVLLIRELDGTAQMLAQWGQWDTIVEMRAVLREWLHDMLEKASSREARKTVYRALALLAIGTSAHWEYILDALAD